MWEPPCAEVQPPPGDAPLVLVAPSTAQDPEHRLLQAVLAGLARRGRARAGDVEPAPAARPGARPRQHPARGVALLRPDDAPVRAGHLPRRSRHAGSCPGVLVPGSGRAARRRHGRERRPAGLGGRRRPAPLAAAHARHPAPGRAAGAGAPESGRAGGATGRVDGPAIPLRREPPTSSRRSPRADRTRSPGTLRLARNRSPRTLRLARTRSPRTPALTQNSPSLGAFGALCRLGQPSSSHVRRVAD